MSDEKIMYDVTGMSYLVEQKHEIKTNNEKLPFNCPANQEKENKYKMERRNKPVKYEFTRKIESYKMYPLTYTVLYDIVEDVYQVHVKDNCGENNFSSEDDFRKFEDAKSSCVNLIYTTLSDVRHGILTCVEEIFNI